MKYIYSNEHKEQSSLLLDKYIDLYPFSVNFIISPEFISLIKLKCCKAHDSEEIQ